MMKRTALLWFLLSLPLAAQQVINGARAFPQANDGSTGTTVNLLAKVNTSGNAIKALTTDTTVPVYICVTNCGTTGNAGLAESGIASCIMDSTIASSAGGDYVIASVTTAGDCHAQSAAPSAGVWVIGFLGASSTASTVASPIVLNGFVFGSTGAAPAFPITVTGGVSGAVPCFTSTTNEAAGTLLAANALVVGGGAGACPATGSADFTYATHTLTGGASGLVDLSAEAAGGLKIPVVAGCTSASNGAICYDTTNGNSHQRTNAADSLSVAEAAAIAAGFIPKATDATHSLITASLCDEAITTANTLTCSNTAGIAGVKFTSTGTTAGFIDFPQGTTSSAVAPCNVATSICEQAPTAVTSYLVTKPGVSATGVITNNVSAAVITQGFSGDANHSATVTTGSGTSIGSTSLCSTGNCPAGTYRVNVYIDITTACGTTGTYIVNLIYTDDQGSKTVPVNISGTGAVPATGILTTTSTANFGQEVQVIRSTGAASINYSTTATACGTAGPMVGKLYLSVEPVQ